MKDLTQIRANLKDHLILNGGTSEDDGMAVELYLNYATLKIIASWGGGWDHISVSKKDRCSTWEEMCFVKDIFFHPAETVIQYHPAKNVYVNNHPNCLHLWRPQNIDIPTPPLNFV